MILRLKIEGKRVVARKGDCGRGELPCPWTWLCLFWASKLGHMDWKGLEVQCILQYILQHESGMVAHSCKPSYYRTKAGGLKARGQTRLHRETLCQKSKLENWDAGQWHSTWLAAQALALIPSSPENSNGNTHEMSPCVTKPRSRQAFPRTHSLQQLFPPSLQRKPLAQF